MNDADAGVDDSFEVRLTKHRAIWLASVVFALCGFMLGILIAGPFVGWDNPPAAVVSLLVIFGISFLLVARFLYGLLFQECRFISANPYGLRYTRGFRRFSVPWDDLSAVDVVVDGLNSWPECTLTAIRMSGDCFTAVRYRRYPRAPGTLFSDGYTHAFVFVERFGNTGSPLLQYYLDRSEFATDSALLTDAIRLQAGPKFGGLKIRPPDDIAGFLDAAQQAQCPHFPWAPRDTPEWLSVANPDGRRDGAEDR